MHCDMCLCPDCGVFILAIDDNPAKASGLLQSGDEIISIDGRSLLDYSHQQCLQTLRAVHRDGTLTIRRRHSEMATKSEQQTVSLANSGEDNTMVYIGNCGQPLSSDVTFITSH